jgi:hypothetical protein
MRESAFEASEVRVDEVERSPGALIPQVEIVGHSQPFALTPSPLAFCRRHRTLAKRRATHGVDHEMRVS